MKTQGFYDVETKEYFDSHVPEYHTARYDFILSFVKKTQSPDSSFIELAAGAGNVIPYFIKATRIKRFVGADISENLVKIANQTTGVPVYLASILDKNLPKLVGDNYNYVLLGQALHHLVGKTREKSKANTRFALLNAWKLLRPGYFLLVCEPVISPSITGDIIFWVKRFLTKFVNRRIEFGDQYHNLGVPVVSFLSEPELHRMILNLPGAFLVGFNSDVKPVSLLKRFAFMRSAKMISVIVQKVTGGTQPIVLDNRKAEVVEGLSSNYN